jgi:hypothetical protein
MSRLAKVHFRIAFPNLIEPVPDFWAVFVKFLTTGKFLPKKFRLSGTAGHPDHLTAKRGDSEMVLSPLEIEAVIRDRNLTGFAVDAGQSDSGLRFHLWELCDVRERSVLWSEFYCEVEHMAIAPDSWTLLIESLISRWRAIGAWQYLLLYQAWQWTRVKNSAYETTFGSFPKTFLTYPDPDYDGLGECRTFVDQSRNPGRPKTLLPGTNFYPTAEMWLGPHFWQYAKCTKEEALAAGFWLETRDTPHYLYLKCWPTAFTRPDGEQGRMQQRLWKLFFHEDCEWPPGSGTICDEPMYGPPELMPDYLPPQRT